MRNFIWVLLLLSLSTGVWAQKRLPPVKKNINKQHYDEGWDIGWKCWLSFQKDWENGNIREKKVEKRDASGKQQQQGTEKKTEIDMKTCIKWGGTLIMVFGVCTVILVRRKKRKRGNAFVSEDKSDESNGKGMAGDKELPKKPVGVIPSVKSAPDISPAVSDSKCNSFCMDGDNHLVIGASVRGKGHLQMELPCQDNHKYTYLGKGWGIAVVSDGAGSATKSQIGSKIVVERATTHFIDVIKSMKWMECGLLPSNEDWSQIAYSVLRKVYDDIVVFAQNKEIEVKDLNATAIVLIHSPFGLLSTHIGDGRAGYRNSDGEWCSVIVPHKGEEANQTIFITSQFWNAPSFRLSGHLIPESRVVREKVTGFTLMSDGCESTSWQVSRMDGNTGKVCDPNLPFQKFYDAVTKTLVQYHQENVDITERAESWYSFLDSGNAFRSESDDKTLIIGLIQ